MQATVLIFVHKDFIVGIESLNLTIQEKQISQRDISNMLRVLAKMLISMHASAIMGIKSINLTIQNNTT